MKNTTEIICVIDKSGSMFPLQADTVGGFNRFLKEQQELPGEANLTLILFDTEYAVIHSGKPIKQVEPLNNKLYNPGGCTALLDALAKGINETGSRLSSLPEAERPNKVICVVITDGEENSSREFKLNQVKDMVKHQQEKYSWEFLFLGSDINSFDSSASLGIQPNRVAMYSNNSAGVLSVYEGTSAAVKGYRLGGSSSLEQSDWKAKVSKTDDK